MVICDVSEQAVERVRRRHPEVDVVADARAMTGADIDVFAPCALGGALDDDTVARLRARIVCGAANNQLAHSGVEKQLDERGILYAPDYVVNSGGVIQVADEIERIQHGTGARQGGPDLRHDSEDLRDRGGGGSPSGGRSG